MKTFDEYKDIVSHSEDDPTTIEYEDIDSGRYDVQDADDEFYSEDDIPMALEYWDKKIDEKVPAHYEDVNTKRRDRKSKPKKKKMSRLKKTLIIIGSIFLVCVLILGGVYLTIYGKLQKAEESEHKNSYISDDKLIKDNGVTNILLMGVDARESETSSRSDTIILVSINTNTKKIKLTSFLRDSYVEIPGHKSGKINSACAQGGYGLVWDTIEYNFKVKIDSYMMVDFQAFEELIDAIGGVDVEVTEKEANYLNKTWQEWSLTGNKLHFDSGESVHLNGEQALMFCRIRKLDSDFKRTERQRRTIAAVKEGLMDTDPTKIMTIANKVLPLVETDITSAELLSLGVNSIVSYLNYDIESFQIPIDGTYETNTSNYQMKFDIDETATKLQEFIYS